MTTIPIQTEAERRLRRVVSRFKETERKRQTLVQRTLLDATGVNSILPGVKAVGQAFSWLGKQANDFIDAPATGMFGVTEPVYADKRQISPFEPANSPKRIFGATQEEPIGRMPSYREAQEIGNRQPGLRRAITGALVTAPIPGVGISPLPKLGLRAAARAPAAVLRATEKLAPTTKVGHAMADSVRLPKELAGAKPRYSSGTRPFTLAFDDDIDKALYIVAQTKKSTRDADYLRFAMEATGMDEAATRAAGTQVRARIKEMARTAEKDVTSLRVSTTPPEPKPNIPSTGTKNVEEMPPETPSPLAGEVTPLSSSASTPKTRADFNKRLQAQAPAPVFDQGVAAQAVPQNLTRPARAMAIRGQSVRPPLPQAPIPPMAKRPAESWQAFNQRMEALHPAPKAPIIDAAGSSSELPLPAAAEVTGSTPVQRTSDLGAIRTPTPIKPQAGAPPTPSNLPATLVAEVPPTGRERILHGALEVANLPRVLQTFGDLSAPLRQGIIFGASHPQEWAAGWGPMIKAFGSEAGEKAVFDAIASYPHAKQMEISKTYLAPRVGEKVPNISMREEAFMSNLTDKIPGLKQAVRASNRAYVTFLNKLRADVFETVITSWERQGKIITDDELIGLGRWINRATGRGSLGPLEHGSAGAVANAAFFSPRYFLSRIQAPLSLFEKSPLVRKQAARDLAIFVGEGVTALTLMDLSGMANVEVDPRSSDFGKVRIGPVRYDFWGGFQPIARYTAQLMSGQRKAVTTGKIAPVDEEDTIMRFLRSKTSPAVGTVWDIKTGKTFSGEDTELTKEMAESVIPLFAQDLYDAIQVLGPVGSLAALPSGVGLGVQVFDSGASPVSGATRKPTFKKAAPARSPTAAGGAPRKPVFSR